VKLANSSPPTTEGIVTKTTDITQPEEFLKAKLAALAEFAAGAGHEINNPVATIVGRAELLLKDETNPERRQSLLTIGAQALRIRDMIGDVMLFGRPPKPEPKTLDLIVAIDDVCQKLNDSIRAKSMTVRRQGDGAATIWADETQLRIVISNLLINAASASLPNSTITIECRSNSLDHKERAIFTINDRGVGFSDLEREHLFDPFFSGRQAGRGLGFGLPKCWRIVEQHGGRIECDSSPNTGTTFRVFWPKAA